jgi:uncharacterized protein
MLASVAETDLDGGPRTTKPGTLRMCALTRQVRPIDELIRFVVAPTGEVVADLKRKLPGRGLWISASRSAVGDAAKRGVFNKGFRRDVRLPGTFADDTERLMVSGVIEALAMAAKAGQTVAGFAKVENTLKRGQAAALIHASDGAADGIRKLDKAIGGTALTLLEGSDGEFPVLSVLSSAELDLALGRTNVIHAALLAGPAGKTFLSRCHALARFRANAPGETAKENLNSTKTRANAPEGI